MRLKDMGKTPEERRIELIKILQYREDFIEVFSDYLKHHDGNYFKALKELAEYYEFSESDMKLVKNYLNTDILHNIEEFASEHGLLKPKNQIIDEDSLNIRLKNKDIV